MRNREHQYEDGYDRSFEGKIIEWNEENSVKQMKWVMVERAREPFVD